MSPGVINAQRLVMRPTDNDPLSILNWIFDWRAYRDRFNIVNQYSVFNFTEKPQYNDQLYFPNDRVAFSEVADKRACEIIEKYKQGTIVVSWSGGVDSSAVLCSLLRNNVDIKRLRVVCGESSIEEYPLMFHYLQDILQVPMIITDSLWETLAAQHDACVLLNGYCGDQLYGANIHQYYPNLYNKHWKAAAKEIIHDRVIGQRKIQCTNKQIDQALNLFDYYCAKIGIPIIQWCEFCWLYSFAFKWEYYAYEHKLRLYGFNPKVADKSIAFYDSEDFQKLSIDNFSRVTGYNPFQSNHSQYKFPMKMYIYEYLKDQYYFENKGKFGGRISGAEKQHPITVLTDDGVYHSYKYDRLQAAVDRQQWSWSIADKYRKINADN